MTAPTQLEILDALMRVLDNQGAHQAREKADRDARCATDQAIVAAIGKNENTWARIHAFFPETQWDGLGAKLDRLERSGAIHWSATNYRVGPRMRWTVEGGYAPVYDTDKTVL